MASPPQDVSIWSDQISRTMLDDGELARRVETDAVTGVTSNPSIFASAIVGTETYDDRLSELKSEGHEPEEIVKRLMGEDIADACDVLAPVFDATEGRDGFVSVEVSPTLASDTDATVAEARDWVKRIDRPNLLVKVPATPEGVPAIERLIGEGISVNVTLIFSLDRYLEVIDAYISGLENLHADGGNLAPVASVASFFVSRFDSEVDRASRRNHRWRCSRSTRKDRRGQRPSRLRAVPGEVLGPQVRGADPAGGPPAKTIVGFDIDQEPVVQRFAVRGEPGGG